MKTQGNSKMVLRTNLTNAAPAMLYALEDLLKQLDEGGLLDVYEPYIGFGPAKAAIALAKGDTKSTDYKAAARYFVGKYSSEDHFGDHCYRWRVIDRDKSVIEVSHTVASDIISEYIADRIAEALNADVYI